MNKHLTIAIDGPVGSGKGTLSLALSEKLGIAYLYTGGMYRGLTLACIRSGAELSDEKAVLSVLSQCNLHLSVTSGQTVVYLGDEDISEAIIRPEVSNNTPIVAALPGVREEMVRRQKEIVEGQGAVVEGRDIATVVAPNADVKIYLTATLEERARRRYMQFQEKGIQKTYEEVMHDTEERDRKDMSRTTSPLINSEEAVVLDTTDETIEETVERVMSILKERNLL